MLNDLILLTLLGCALVIAVCAVKALDVLRDILNHLARGRDARDRETYRSPAVTENENERELSALIGKLEKRGPR